MENLTRINSTVRAGGAILALVLAVTSGAHGQWTYNSTGTAIIPSDPSKAVGVGTVNPQASLHVASSSHNYIQLERPNTSKENGLRWSNGSATQFWILMDDDDSGRNPSAAKSLQIESAVLPGETDALPRIRFPSDQKYIQACLSGGNFGIGPGTPSEVLEVFQPNTHNYISIGRSNRSSESGLAWKEAGTPKFYMYMDNNPNTDYFQLSSATLQTQGENDATPRLRFPVDNKDIHACLSGGKFGIGPGTPVEVLDVFQPNTHNYISVGRSNRNSESGLVWKEAGNPKFFMYMDNNPNADYFQFSSATLQSQGENDATPRVRFPVDNKDIYACLSGGKMGIGTSDPKATLDVAGNAKISGNLQVKVWSIAPDYVFDEHYKLASLESVEKFVGQNKHLPEIPSAREFKEKGLDLADMNMKLLRKVEELTLYAIKQERRDREHEKEIAELKRTIGKLESKIR